jgi:hypothetical protein
MDIDLKLIVKNTYKSIIKAIIDRILLFQFDDILNDLINLHIDIGDKPADKELLITDKFFIIKNLWKAIVETLYDKYLPDSKYEFKWDIEITPYTIMLCNLQKNTSNIEIDTLKKITGFSDDDIENKYEKVANTIGLDLKFLEQIPESYLPKSKRDQLNMLFRLMNFPPLGEMAIFYNEFYFVSSLRLNEIASFFSGIESFKMPAFNIIYPFSLSVFHFSHTTFKKFGIIHFEKLPELISFKKDFEEIKTKAIANKDKFTDTFICPCCGKPQTIKLPEEVLQYKLIINNRTLSKKIGLLFLKEFISEFEETFANGLVSFLDKLNKVDSPECIILVEGDSEENSIPILSFRKRFILSNYNIHVYNSKSKEKLKADFFSLKAKYPNRKIICILDSDAVREREDILRVIKDNKDKYHLVFIEKGTFEDLFDLNFSITILNELFPDGEPIVRDDFDEKKFFLININKILFAKKNARFDKVAFAKKISLKLDINLLPKEINEVIETAKLFTKKKKFLR